MKTLIQHNLGADGGIAGLYVDAGVLELKVSYPVQKILDPIEKELDGLLDKVKAAIPGTWDDVLIENLKVQYKAAVLKAITEGAQAPA